MDYQKTYDQIIKRAKTRQIEGYVEKHHIIPKCMGGSNNISNLVKLTAREHFLCHQLLCEIYPEPKLKIALWLMIIGKGKNIQNNYKINISSRIYEKLKIEAREIIKNKLKGRKLTEQHIQSIRDSHLGKKKSEECKIKMRKPKRNTDKMRKPKSEAHKKAVSNGMIGKKWKLSEESLITRRKYYKDNKERGNKISLSNNKEVEQYDLNKVFINTFKSVTHANLFLGKKKNASSIPLCCNGIYKKAFGYIWKYKKLI